ncbi:unnamed protein product [Hermetia illucens]|uniref:Uncharacterized protein n=1 Tax=Hermetia illucens TaxID=343691 RepID=A0A7R8Z242_HERIL|nr:uncharacterized protein LOC119657396 [Hermetia illucens]XP_037920214.1 uncharacterized protein LOC119657396 [Hermetia illucens]CAD7090407.1 unnamed protein product [Hermetia illucens]
MSLPTNQNLVLAALNRAEIIKHCKSQDLLRKTPHNVTEEKLKEAAGIAKHLAQSSKSKTELQIKVERQRKMLQELLLQFRNAGSTASGGEKEGLANALRLIEKINYMRKLTLVMLTNNNVVSSEQVLAVTRDLMEDKTLQNYPRK